MRIDHNVIQNTNFLGYVVEHSLALKLSLFALWIFKRMVY